MARSSYIYMYTFIYCYRKQTLNKWKRRKQQTERGGLLYKNYNLKTHSSKMHSAENAHDATLDEN